MDKPDLEKVKTDVASLKFREAQAREQELLAMANEFYKEMGDNPATPDQKDYVVFINKTIEELQHHIKDQGEYEALRKRQQAAYGKTQGGVAGPGAPGYEGKMDGPQNTDHPLASRIL